MNVLCALKLTELWNTSLLFDLNYKFINGSLAFSLAKSIYYYCYQHCHHLKDKRESDGKNWDCMKAH